jgi:hypothetical protein
MNTQTRDTTLIPAPPPPSPSPLPGNICVYCPGGPDSDFEYSTQVGVTRVTAPVTRAISATRAPPELPLLHAAAPAPRPPRPNAPRPLSPAPSPAAAVTRAVSRAELHRLRAHLDARHPRAVQPLRAGAPGGARGGGGGGVRGKGAPRPARRPAERIHQTRRPRPMIDPPFAPLRLNPPPPGARPRGPAAAAGAQRGQGGLGVSAICGWLSRQHRQTVSACASRGCWATTGCLSAPPSPRSSSSAWAAPSCRCPAPNPPPLLPPSAPPP